MDSPLRRSRTRLPATIVSTVTTSVAYPLSAARATRSKASGVPGQVQLEPQVAVGPATPAAAPRSRSPPSWTACTAPVPERRPRRADLAVRMHHPVYPAGPSSKGTGGSRRGPRRTCPPPPPRPAPGAGTATPGTRPRSPRPDLLVGRPVDVIEDRPRESAAWPPGASRPRHSRRRGAAPSRRASPHAAGPASHLAHLHAGDDTPWPPGLRINPALAPAPPPAAGRRCRPAPLHVY